MFWCITLNFGSLAQQHLSTGASRVMPWRYLSPCLKFVSFSTHIKGATCYIGSDYDHPHSGLGMCTALPLSRSQLDEGRPPSLPWQHHAQSRWSWFKAIFLLLDGRTPKRINALLLFHSGLYHDAIIATNLALQLSPDLVVRQVAIQPAQSFLFRQISFSSS